MTGPRLWQNQRSGKKPLTFSPNCPTAATWSVDNSTGNGCWPTIMSSHGWTDSGPAVWTNVHIVQARMQAVQITANLQLHNLVLDGDHGCQGARYSKNLARIPHTHLCTQHSRLQEGGTLLAVGKRLILMIGNVEKEKATTRRAPCCV